MRVYYHSPDLPNTVYLGRPGKYRTLKGGACSTEIRLELFLKAGGFIRP